MVENQVFGRAAVGAWIEISFFAQDTPPDGVAPLAEGELKKVNLEASVKFL